MKKFLPLLVSFICFAGLVKAQYVTIPDIHFRAFLQQQYPSCFNSSGMMDTTCSSIVNETKLQLETEGSAVSLQGIQYFKSLTYLDCSFNQLTSLSTLPTSLTYLDCSENPQLSSLPPLPHFLLYLYCRSDNIVDSLPALPDSLIDLDCSANDKLFNDFPITRLPVLPKSLRYLNCNYNRISSLPSLPASLDTLICSDNSNLVGLDDTLGNLTSLPALPNSLIYLDCSNNKISSLPTLPNSLTYLDFGSNKISSLPILPASLITLSTNANPLKNLPASLPASITSLDCSSDQLSILPPLPSSLFSFNCSGNALPALPSLPQTLNHLDCHGNQLTSLGTLPPLLYYLNCSTNLLTTLPHLPDILYYLNCYQNLLNSLPQLPTNLNELDCYQNNSLYCLPVLPNSLSTLIIDTLIRCLPNIPNSNNYNQFYLYAPDSTGLVHGISLPLCNPINNVNHCSEFPLVTGTAFYDNNNNGVKDAGELYHPYVKMQLSNGDFTFTNSNGYYEIAADDGPGSYTLSAYAPTYYKAVPVLTNYNFTSFDTLVTQSIALQPTVSIDLVSINAEPYHRFARPGFDYPIVVNYTNVGTTTLSPAITFNYDNTLLTYDSSSDHSVVDNGNSLTLNETNFVPGQTNSFVAYFTAKTTDILGDTLKAKLSITANAASSVDSIATIISSSFDPNDKEATPQLTPQQVIAGKSINYTIRFQNTGNDTAFNIVIADTLSNLLQASTLQMISSSKPCKVTVTGNVVFFEFLNVLLPDNKTNDIGSNGYVSFSVQPQASVSSGSITNTASIYFDYNTPVVTNTASTLIHDFTVPLKLISFNALIQPGTTNALLYWSTASEINTKSFVIEQSTDGVNFTSVATVPAKGIGGHSYSYTIAENASSVYYRLKMIDIDGQYTYSSIVKIKNVQDVEMFTILTNPAKDKIYIKTIAPSLTDTNAKIINSEGIIVKSFVLQQGTQTVDVSMLAPGFYYIKTGLATKKVVINR